MMFFEIENSNHDCTKHGLFCFVILSTCLTLHYSTGNIQRIREILDVDVSQRDTCSPQDGATPLMFAAMTGRIDIAQLFVERGCDINKQDNISGWTALMQATYHGYVVFEE